MSKLDEARKKYDIPELPYGSAWKNVQIFRFAGDEKTAGGLYVPQTSQGVRSRGILLDAGLAATDALADELIEIGDEVYFGHFAGRDREVEQRQGREAGRILECKVEDIHGSKEQLQRRKNYVRYRDPETNEHMWRKK